MADPISEPNQRLIRSFSDTLREEMPADALSRGLAARIAIDGNQEDQLAALRDQWNLLLLEGREMAVQSVPDDEVILLSQSRKLYEAWNKFSKRLPEEQRQGYVDEIPSLKQLVQCVEKASQTWQEKREGKSTGRLKQGFANLCQSFQDHRSLLAVVPKDDKYVCLLTGSLSAIAQASTNHQEIANAVVDSLEELSQDIAYWNSLISQHGYIKGLRRLILELYVIVFEFLTEIFTNWSRSSWKRFVTSFDDRAFEKLFDEKKGRIRAIEQRMVRLTDLEFQKRVTERVSALESSFRTICDRQESTASDPRQLLLDLGSNVQKLLDRSTTRPQLQIIEREDTPVVDAPMSEPHLDEVLQTVDHEGREHLDAVDPSEVNMSSGDILLESDILQSDVRYRRDDILNVLEPLKTSFSQDVQALVDVTLQARQVMIDLPVQRRLLSWNKDLHSQGLWVQGPHDVSKPSQNTLTAGCLVALSRQSDIPCVFYFAALSASTESGNVPLRHQEALMKMLKSLIFQTTLLIPATFTSKLDFTPARFEALQRNDLSVDDTLKLFCDVWSLAPPHLHSIIDGIQNIEDRDDFKHTQNLFNVLDTLAKMHQDGATASGNGPEATSDDTRGLQSSSPIRKLCFTTDGYVDALARLLEQDSLNMIEYLHEDGQLVGEETINLMPWQGDEME